MSEAIKNAVRDGRTALGIEFGSTRIKAVLVDESHNPIAMGTHDWENRLENNIWTYSLDDIWNGLQGCYKSLTDDVKELMCYDCVMGMNVFLLNCLYKHFFLHFLFFFFLNLFVLC